MVQFCEFRGNRAKRVGGAIASASNGAQVVITIDSCLVVNNSARNCGGGIMGSKQSSILSTSSCLLNNEAPSGAAMCMAGYLMMADTGVGRQNSESLIQFNSGSEAVLKQNTIVSDDPRRLQSIQACRSMLNVSGQNNTPLSSSAANYLVLSNFTRVVMNDAIIGCDVYGRGLGASSYLVYSKKLTVFERPFQPPRQAHTEADVCTSINRCNTDMHVDSQDSSNGQNLEYPPTGAPACSDGLIRVLQKSLFQTSHPEKSLFCLPRVCSSSQACPSNSEMADATVLSRHQWECPDGSIRRYYPKEGTFCTPPIKPADREQDHRGIVLGACIGLMLSLCLLAMFWLLKRSAIPHFKRPCVTCNPSLVIAF